MSFFIKPTDYCCCQSDLLYRDCCSRLTKLPRDPSPELLYRYWTKYVTEVTDSALTFLEDADRLEDLSELTGELLEFSDRDFADTSTFDDRSIAINAFILCHLPIPEDYLSDIEEDDIDDDTPSDDANPLAYELAVPLIKLIEESDTRYRRDPYKSIIKEMAGTTFSWLRIIDFAPNFLIQVEDIFLGESFYITDRLGQHLEKNSIVCAQVLRFGGVAILSGTFPWSLSADSLASLRNIAKDLVQKHNVTHGIALSHLTRFAISSAAIQVFDELTARPDSERSPTPKITHNTDGDPIEMIILTYSWDEISVSDMAAKVCGAIDHAENAPAPEILALDANDSPTDIRLVSTKQSSDGDTLGNVIIAQITVRPKQLTVSVNSQKRAARLRERLATLSEILTFVSEQSGDTDSVMMINSGNMLQLQELTDAEREILATHMRTTQDKWLKTPVPALRGMTPEQAARSPIGRQLLEDLLDSFDRLAPDKRAAGVSHFDVTELRQRLGVPRNSQRT